MDTDPDRRTQKVWAAAGSAPETGLHAPLTRRIIGAVHRVHRALGTGFLEEVYRNALLIELQQEGCS